MGLRSGAMMCQRMTSAINHLFCQEGYKGVCYLDDYAGAEVTGRAHQAYHRLGSLLNDSGLEESLGKACAPSTRMTFLGIEIDSQEMVCRIPEVKVVEIGDTLRRWLKKRAASKRQLQSLIGQLQFVAKCVFAGRIFISRLLDVT